MGLCLPFTITNPEYSPNTTKTGTSVGNLNSPLSWLRRIFKQGYLN